MGELKANNGLLSRADFVKHIVDMKIEGLGRQKVYDLIKAQIALPVPPFRELNGKMVMTEQYVQSELPLDD